MLSTECSARSVAVAARQSGSESQTRLIVVHTYNQHMNRVDIADQCAVYYSFLCKRVSGGESFLGLQRQQWWTATFSKTALKAQPPGLLMCSSREFCHQVSCLCSTFLLNCMSRQMPTSWAIRVTEDESTASPHWQSLGYMTVYLHVTIRNVCQAEALYFPLSGLFWHVLFSCGPAMKLQHGFINS